MPLTPILAVASVVAAVSIYGFLSYWRFPRISQSTLAELSRDEDMQRSDFGLALFLFIVWGSILWALDFFGYPNLVGLVWAGTILFALIFGYRKNSYPRECSICGQSTQTFRKENERNVPAIYFVHVCPNCKHYRDQLVIAIGSDA
jgi:hypothetical protein